MLTQNWLMMFDVENLLALTSFEVVRRGGEVLCPFPIPLIATFLNKFVVKFWPFHQLALASILVARRMLRGDRVHLVYPMEDRAMRFFNVLGNRFFSMAFTWLLNQRIKDTLCGTKVLSKTDYELIAANRSYFGEFDPFGDFDLLFGASKCNLRIMDLPIRYAERTYGDTNIQRWRHGVLLLRMALLAMRRIKFV